MKNKILFFLGVISLFLSASKMESSQSILVENKPFRFVGAFVPGWHWASEVWTEAICEEMIKGAKDNGIRVFHLMLPPIEPQLGVFSEPELRKLDIFLDYAAKHGVYVILSFIQGYAIAVQDQDPYYNPGGIEGLIKDNKLKDAYKKRIETIISRQNTVNSKPYLCDSTIMAWNLVSEPISAPWNYPIHPPNVSISELRNWLQEIADFVKQIDPFHLVTVFTGAAIDSMENYSGNWPQVFNVQSLDFIYAEDADARILEVFPGMNANDYPLRLMSLAKPLLVEFSFTSGIWDQSQISTNYTWQAETLRNMAERYSESGAAAVTIFSWRSDNPLYISHIPPADIPYSYNITIKPICDMMKNLAAEWGSLNWPGTPLPFVTVVQRQYTLTIEANEGGTTTPAPGTYTYDIGTPVAVTAVPNANYRFDKWTGAASGSSNPITITMVGNKTIKPNFLRQYTLAIEAGEGGTTTPAPGTYMYDTGTSVTGTALPNTNYRFNGWTGHVPSGHEFDNPLSITMDSDKSVAANFLRIIYPPLQLAGQKVLNRSVSQAEYINVITWNPNPNNANIVGYRIHQIEGNSEFLIAEVNSTTYKFQHRKVEKNKTYMYSVVAVNNENREGDPAYVTIR